jgi:hypothetical protein
MNDITDPKLVDRLTGNAAFNAVPVRVERVPAEAELVAAPATASA